MPPKAPSPLATALDRRTVEGELYERLEDGKLRCVACGHRCLILDGLRGICKVRFNEGGRLRVPFGYVGALQCDPIEKKPFNHVLPGAKALTFGMQGCDFHCSYCQNWITSQALRDPEAVSAPGDVTPQQLVDVARHYRAGMVASSYNEPLITAEWAVAVFKVARAHGFKTAFISNGNGTPEVLEYIRPWTDCYKIDLKSMRDKNYRALGGKLDNVRRTVRMVYEMGFWMEIVTLIVPGFNDSDEELEEAAQFLATISPDIPWHVTAFHKDYKMTDPDDTPPETLLGAAAIGKRAGLRYVYAGNLPGRVGDWENTRCPRCDGLLIQRFGYLVRRNRVGTSGRCPDCHHRIPGIWV